MDIQLKRGLLDVCVLDTFIIRGVDRKAWYDNVGIHIGTPKLTIYLPKAEYSSMYIKEGTVNVKSVPIQVILK